ncbi:serine/threonine-protein kinase [Streptomyces lydicus]|uniref:serine/threonine-protein kinase n=1 Tax=Streptomyces lydicus TaxID=47763 RepID=UPI0009A00BAF|nr:serine/threonine-protein kinase [Streptomyces lydicus]
MTQPIASPRFSADEVADSLGVPVTFLGSGAYGDTWKAGAEAVKIICVDDYPRTRLEREVDGLTRVNSPYVVDFRGLDEFRLGGQKRPALRFEYIAGGDAEGYLNRGDLLPVELTPGFLQGLLLGVQALHKAATIHRDIKPANISLRHGDWCQPVLLDLGLSKQMDATTITVYPGHIGTPPYMAPEQLEGRRARKAADLWAVGVSVRQLISGRHPFYSSGKKYSVDEAFSELMGGPEDLPPDCPEEVKQVLDRLTSVVEHERGSSASNLLRLRKQR